MITKNKLLSALGLEPPDNVGSSEYHAIYELLDIALTDIGDDENPIEIIESILVEFKLWAVDSLKEVRRNRKHIIECSVCHQQVSRKTAHKHQKTYICDGCWDERLRTTA